MHYLIIGFLVSIGFGIGKIITDILNEVIFARLHNNNIYRIICKKDCNRPTKKKYAIVFNANVVK